MNQKPSKLILALITFVILTLGCQTISNMVSGAPTATPAVVLGEKPISMFTPPRNSVQVGVEEPLLLESYHLNDRPLDRLEVSINGQPQTDFPPDLATVQIMVDDQTATTVSSLTPDLPTTEWTVSLLWTGRVPGVYDLELKVIDIDGREGDPVVQRIEVR